MVGEISCGSSNVTTWKSVKTFSPIIPSWRKNIERIIYAESASINKELKLKLESFKTSRGKYFVIARSWKKVFNLTLLSPRRNLLESIDD